MPSNDRQHLPGQHGPDGAKHACAANKNRCVSERGRRHCIPKGIWKKKNHDSNTLIDHVIYILCIRAYLLYYLEIGQKPFIVHKLLRLWTYRNRLRGTLTFAPWCNTLECVQRSRKTPTPRLGFFWLQSAKTHSSQCTRAKCRWPKIA